MALRWRSLPLPPPRRGEFRSDAPVGPHLVHRREESPADAVEPLEWCLLTSVPVKAREEAHWMPGRYRLRRRIEYWQRVLRSGCKVECLGHRKAERIERAVTINATIAWRLTAMTLRGRATPELPAEVLHAGSGIMALQDFAADRWLPAPGNPGLAVLTLALPRGYRNRRKNPPPGQQKLGEGYKRLAVQGQGCERVIGMDRASKLDQRLSSDWLCGQEARRGGLYRELQLPFEPRCRMSLGGPRLDGGLRAGTLQDRPATA